MIAGKPEAEGGFAIFSGKFLRGLSVPAPLTILNNASYLTLGLNEDLLDTFANSTFADATYRTLNEKFRISSNLTDSVTIDRFDSDGATITDTWLPAANFTWARDTHKAGLIMNGVDILTKLRDTYTKTESDVIANAMKDEMNTATNYDPVAPLKSVPNIATEN